MNAALVLAVDLAVALMLLESVQLPNAAVWMVDAVCQGLVRRTVMELALTELLKLLRLPGWEIEQDESWFSAEEMVLGWEGFFRIY